jgi:membrane-anchored glycerophosphoryl diester phosphodiesterase (GDPDase)
MNYELRRLSFFETLGQTFSLYVDNFIPLLLISFACTFPAIGLDVLAEVLEAANPVLAKILGILLFFVLLIGIYMLCAALMTAWVFKKYLKQPQRPGRYIGDVLPLLFPVSALAVIAVLMVGGPAVVLYLVAGDRAAVFLYIYIIPGIYLLIGLVLAAPVKVVEGKTVRESLQRSFALANKSKLTILAYLMIIGLLKRLLIDQLLMGGLILDWIGNSDLTLDTQQLLAQVSGYLVEILFNPLSACLFMLVYFNLKIKQEGLNTFRNIRNIR